MKALITYATSHDSTREIAERLAIRLASHIAPVKVECKPIGSLPALSLIPNQYSAVIIGSEIKLGQWIRPAREFLRRNREYFSGTITDMELRQGVTSTVAPSVWAFTVGPSTTSENRLIQQQEIDMILKDKLRGSSLRGHRLFRGMLNKNEVDWFARLFLCCCPSDDYTFCDHKGWHEVDVWADEIGCAMREEGIGMGPGEDERELIP